ncbi:MAG: glycosyltransferase family 2 protein [Candidatus Promineifilaceae bacterium]|nr:glycosyltransferase family 2 protein [Candidatus Promineifilaceae bacterium]
MVPTVSILILNYNSMTHLQTNLDSVFALDYPADRMEIILVDNDSTDGSVAWVAEQYPPVKIVQNKQNLGFAAGNNAGAAAATGEWLAILNPDTRVRPDWLQELVRPTQQDPAVTSVASKMLNWDGTAVDFGDAAINFMSWGNQPGIGEPDLGQFQRPKPLLFACGGAMLIRRSVFLEVEGFDPDFFAYFEDVDLGWRLWLLGYRIVYAPQAVVYHRHHGSWDSVNDVKRWVLAERNTLYTVCKNYNDDNLSRILPAALLLVLQRAFLDVHADPAYFGLPQLPQLSTWRYYLYQTGQLIRSGHLGELGRRFVAELGRRLIRRDDPPPVRLPETWHEPEADGRFQMPAIALSRLLAGHDVDAHWDTMMAKRARLQANRRRPDQEIFPLFQGPLVSNFNDAHFIYAMGQIIEKFDLVSLFKYQRSLPITDPTIHQLSEGVSRQLLQLMDWAFRQSGVSEAAFRLGEAEPQAQYSVPDQTAALLAHANHWLWTLPNGELETILRYLQRQIEGFCNTYQVRHD